ncbi:MAG: Pyrimidine-nucleoside phosphorylase [Bacillales bacterium]|nr:Pyrimidine-nucleoside phosphorylase [Bacillales bacterium]
MRMVDIIAKKRNGNILNEEEIRFFVNGYVDGSIPDYQVSALLMTIFYNGMSNSEVSNLTKFMVESGDVINLDKIKGHKVDKHSTGGVGDKTSLIIGPLVAAAGVPVAKMSGRGLGHTGGTLDKLESIKDFKIELTSEQFVHNVNKHKIAIIGQTANLVPADKKLYSLRDVTATVDSIPLIASSIMSKKIAAGADSIVLDVKVGSGAFMKTLNEAKELAETMVQIGKSLNRRTVAILSNMDEPLGKEIGNANEIKEVIEVLNNKGPKDLTEISLTIAAHMAVLADVYNDIKTAKIELVKLLANGKALEKLIEFVKAQGGDPSVINDPTLLPKAQFQFDIKADDDGFISKIDALSIGIAAMLLGAGRKTKDDLIDHAVGISLHKKVGDKVFQGELIATIHSNSINVDETITLINKAYSISKEIVIPNKLIYDVLQ